MDRLSHTQDICCHEEQSVDRLLPFRHDFGTVCLRDVPFDLLCVTTWYVPSRGSLKEMSEANPDSKSGSDSRRSF